WLESWGGARGSRAAMMSNRSTRAPAGAKFFPLLSASFREFPGSDASHQGEMTMGVRRGRGEGSIQQLEDGRWKAWLSLGKNAAGKRRRMALYGKTKQEVQKKLRELLGQLDRGLLADCGKTPCGEASTPSLN